MKTNFDFIPEGTTDEIINKYLKAFLDEKDDMIKEKGIIYAFEQLEKIVKNENDSLYNGYETQYINEINDFIENNLDFNNYDQGVKLEVNLKDETVWLTQKQMAVLFDKDRRTITRHIQNIYKDEELDEKTVCSFF